MKNLQLSHCDLIINQLCTGNILDSDGNSQGKPKRFWITPLDALNNYGCFRLSGRISDLRLSLGYPIQTYTPDTALQFNVITEGEYVKMVHNNKKNFAVYYIAPADREQFINKETGRVAI